MWRLASCVAAAFFVFAPLTSAGTRTARADTLPQKYEYQRVLRDYLATLNEAAFKHGVTASLTVEPSSQDPDYVFRNYLLTLMQQPLVGTKRGHPAVNAPARLFTLHSIEGKDAILKPPVWPEALMSFVQWDYPGNPYFQNVALKRRAFVWCCMNMLMVDEYMETEATSRKPEHFAYQLVILGSPYSGFRDLLPPNVREAYQAGVQQLAQRIIDWGIRGEEHYYDLIIPVGLWYASQVVEDDRFTESVESVSRRLFTDSRYFHPAGYFLDHGGPELARGGTTNHFAVWAALAADWPFAKSAVERIYRLRAHLLLPEPDGSITGPCQFNTQRGAPVAKDSWHWNGTREHAAAMITDEASCQAPWPSDSTLSAAAEKRVNAFNFQLSQNPIKKRLRPGYTYYENDEIPPIPWEHRLWQTYNFPATVNHSYEFYRAGSYARRLQLERQQSPFVSLPFDRPGTFLKNFADAFVVSRQPHYGVVLHTGPVGRQITGSNFKILPEPLGFGGGQLSALWTPRTGSILLGRRRSLTGEESLDKVEEWRQWPIHAVSGLTNGGVVFSSARIPDADVTMDQTSSTGLVTVSGNIAVQQLGQEQKLEAPIRYSRSFQILRDHIRIKTSATLGQDNEFQELYETLPVFHREGRAPQHEETLKTQIDFLVNRRWQSATEQPIDDVSVIRLRRFHGEVRITFDEPQRLRLSPAEWSDTYMTRAVCRNILIDLMANTSGTTSYKLSTWPER